MTLILNTITPEGIVIASDSRQSYSNARGMSRVGSDNARKLFQINNRIGVAISGLAFIKHNNELKNVSNIIDEYIAKNNVSSLNVKEIADNLHTSFMSVYDINEHTKNAKQRILQSLNARGFRNIIFGDLINNILPFDFEDSTGKKLSKKESLPQINYIVSGFNEDNSHEAYSCHVPGNIQMNRDSKVVGREYGASWLGQMDLVSRVILGYDQRIQISPSIKKIWNKNLIEELRGLEYIIQWGTMTIQDAVDFSDLMIKTTSAIQRFSDGIKAMPGDMPGVGGPVDIAIITKKDGFTWLSKKWLTHDKNSIDLY
jgi:hypothetical protein